MSKFHLSAPSASSGGDRWSKDEHLDHLTLFVGPFETREIESAYGPATPTHCESIACVECREAWQDALVFGAAIAPRLVGDPDAEIVVGRLGQGLAKPGRSAPWTLDDPTEADLQAAEQFLEEFAVRLPSGSVMIDTRALALSRPESETF